MLRPDKGLNGSGKENLLKAKTLEIEKISELLDLLCKNFPHPRDYQIGRYAKVQYEGDKRTADDRIQLITDLLEDLKAEQEYLAS